MNKKVRILHLEDSLKDAELIHSVIDSGEIANEYFMTDNETDYLNILEKENIDIILSDYNLPDYNGNGALKVAKERFSYIPFIFVSGKIGEDIAINALVNGATDYVFKNKLERLVPAIKRALREYELESKRKQAEQELVIANKELIFQNTEKEKRATELIKAREKAEESDNLKSAFLNNLSHEIRTPMNQILGFASFLKEPGLPEVTRDEYIDIIEQQSHQLLHIITDIVEVSKLTAGQVNIKTATFNLGRMMNELFASFKPKAENRNLKLYLFKGIVDAESMIQGDQVKLRQIISNLIENAIKFTDAGSVGIEYCRTDNTLIVSVKDTGIGIEEQAKQVIFDHFRQIEITMARKYGGMGLGLSISKAYIQMMSGVIRVESELGVGSTFTIEVPYVPAIRIPERIEGVVLPTVISGPEWQEKTILIAEDEDSNIQLLKAVLLPTGVHLLIAVNGIEAVEQCKTHPEIDVVLMDIKMPRMGGIEATKLIKSFRSDLPVIATTAFAMIDEMEHILEAGCNDYLSKPMRREDLIAKIHQYIFSRQAPEVVRA